MKYLITGLTLLAGLALLPACKKHDDGCVAGQGGNLTIVAFPKHHGAAVVRPYSAWVKFNSKNLPDTVASAFDLIVNADTTEDHVHLKDLKCGDYYIYMKGIDTSRKLFVRGGIPYTVAEGATGEIDIDVPVSEE